MNSKEQKIKEAYGEEFEKHEPNEDGWIRYGSKQNSELHSNCEQKEWLGYFFYRPKSLQGIENNNGWIKIESEDDLPKETDTYWFMSRFTGKVMKDYFTCDSKVLAFHSAQFKLYSHYQPIEKPKPPLY